ncbi:MAG: 2-oxo-4-hydroxy-4-carboxy-5-ureidoimidazoline decarboxylase [Pyrinomonadaceae bacterium]
MSSPKENCYKTGHELVKHFDEMIEGLQRLNTLSRGQAEAELMKCCGSEKWARQMIERRPFEDVNDLSANADSVWWALDGSDWLEAFSHHPKIGEKKAAAAQAEEARAWSAEEQSRASTTAPEISRVLADANRDYERRFGYIFIVCATGKSSEEILSILQQRMGNTPEQELRIAAGEQAKITQLRIRKLLDQ